ncbi:MAG TPA: hypothetical protein VGG00_04000, partial [Rhodanobacter sp.]
MPIPIGAIHWSIAWPGKPTLKAIGIEALPDWQRCIEAERGTNRGWQHGPNDGVVQQAAQPLPIRIRDVQKWLLQLVNIPTPDIIEYMSSLLD